MAFVGNLLWFIFGFGWFWWLYWALGSVILCVTVIGIPFGIAGFKIANYAALPFGRDLIDKRLLGEERVSGTLFGNILWVLLVGVWLSISHILTGITCCLTIIGIPFGIAHFKLARISFAPLGKKSVPVDVAKLAKAKFAHSQLEGETTAKQIQRENRTAVLASASVALLVIIIIPIFIWTGYFMPLRPTVSLGNARNIAIKVDNETIMIDEFSPTSCELKNVEVVKKRKDGSSIKYLAEKAIWLDGRWWFMDCAIQHYTSNGYLSGAPEMVLQKEMHDLSLTPRKILAETNPVEKLTFPEIQKYLKTRTDLSEERRSELFKKSFFPVWMR